MTRMRGRTTSSRFVLRPIPPYRLDLTVWALRRRPRNQIDRWDGATYRRVIDVRGRPTELAVRQAGSCTAPRLILTTTPALRTTLERRQVRLVIERLLGIRLDLADWYRLAAHDARLRSLAQRFLGMKPPRFPTVFEAVVNGFACQQLSLEVGLELLNRLAMIGGTPLGTLPNASHAFPAPQQIARLSPEQIRAIGFSHQKARALIELSRAIVRGELAVDAIAAWTTLSLDSACSSCEALVAGRPSTSYCAASGAFPCSQATMSVRRNGWPRGLAGRGRWITSA